MNRREFLSLFNPIKIAEKMETHVAAHNPPDRSALFRQAMALGIDPANLTTEDLIQIINENAKNR